jgi:hypothetical protein
VRAPGRRIGQRGDATRAPTLGPRPGRAARCRPSAYRDWPECDKSIHSSCFQPLAYRATPFVPFPLNQHTETKGPGIRIPESLCARFGSRIRDLSMSNQQTERAKSLGSGEVAPSVIRRIDGHHARHPAPWHAACKTHPAPRHVAKTRQDESPFSERVSFNGSTISLMRR